MNARMQISMAMQLSSELGRMTQSYNTRLAQLLRSHDVTYPQYAVLDHIMRNGSKAETISQIPKRSRFYNLRLPKSSENFQIVDYCRFQAQKKIVVKNAFP